MDFYKNGLYNSISYQINLKELMGQRFTPQASPTGARKRHSSGTLYKRCFHVFMKTMDSPYERFSMTCNSNNDPTKASCTMDTTGTSLGGFPCKPFYKFYEGSTLISVWFKL